VRGAGNPIRSCKALNLVDIGEDDHTTVSWFSSSSDWLCLFRHMDRMGHEVFFPFMSSGGNLADDDLAMNRIGRLHPPTS